MLTRNHAKFIIRVRQINRAESRIEVQNQLQTPIFAQNQNGNIINLQLHEILENGTENEVVGFVLENCLV